MTRTLIGLTGRSRSGKTTAADALIEHLGYHALAFGDALKDAALILDPLVEEGLRLSEAVEQHGWEVTKDDFPESRRILQALGSDAGWMLHGTQLWVDPVDRAFHRLPAGDPVVVTDIRYAFEADWVRKQGGVVVRILRPEQDDLDGGMSAHSSEVADFEVDLELLNDSGVEELHSYMCQELPALIPSLLSRRG